MMRTASRLDAVESDDDQGDALSQLQTDHRKVERLFARAGLCSGTERRELVTLIIDALTAHAELEETVIYPRIAQTLPAAPWLIEQSVEDHDQMRVVMAALADANDERSVTLALRALQQVVQAHVAVEEGEIFPAFRQAGGSVNPDDDRDAGDDR